MKASELIENIKKLIAEYGDQDIIIADQIEGNDYEMEKIIFEDPYSTTVDGNGNILSEDRGFVCY